MAEPDCQFRSHLSLLHISLPPRLWWPWKCTAQTSYCRNVFFWQPQLFPLDPPPYLHQGHTSELPSPKTGHSRATSAGSFPRWSRTILLGGGDDGGLFAKYDSCEPMDYSLPGSSVHGISQARMLVCCHFFLQGIFLIQGSNLCFLHWQADSLPLSHQGSPYSSGVFGLKSPHDSGWNFLWKVLVLLLYNRLSFPLSFTS